MSEITPPPFKREYGRLLELTIHGINRSSAEAIMLSRSEDYYVLLHNYDPDVENGWAVYSVWRYWDSENTPPFPEVREFRIKRLEYAIERHQEKSQMHLEQANEFIKVLEALRSSEKTGDKDE